MRQQRLGVGQLAVEAGARQRAVHGGAQRPDLGAPRRPRPADDVRVDVLDRAGATHARERGAGREEAGQAEVREPAADAAGASASSTLAGLMSLCAMPGLVQRVGRPRGVLQRAVDLAPAPAGRAGADSEPQREVLHRVGEGVLEDGVVHGDEVGRADGGERAQLAHPALVGELADPVAEDLERDELARPAPAAPAAGPGSSGRGCPRPAGARPRSRRRPRERRPCRPGIDGRRERGRVHP